MTTYNITITSDIVCPWCYIGHTRLSRAITTHKQSHPNDKFNLKYLPFYLQPPSPNTSTNNNIPSFPIKSRPRREMYAEKFGPERARQIEANMTQVSTSEGLTFKFGGMTGSSRNGHRLVYYAQTHGGEKAQNEVMLGLWRRYFEMEVDITRLDVLVEVGVEAGLGAREDVQRFLESGEAGSEVDLLAEMGRDEGVTGVPYYVVQERWAVSGAQDSRAFEMLFKRWKGLEGRGGVEGELGDGVGKGSGNGCL